ncbi:MAG TPA: CHAD domain-containing protein [Burkholderiales bacterium]|nr:CHAD domain-containing protein [Burkholderiales bacterium]
MSSGRRVAFPLRPLDVSALSGLAGFPATRRGGRGGPVKARPATLTPTIPVGGAFKAVMAAGLAHLLANERGLLEGRDPEYLHQTRVALRRLRSALEVFSPPLPERVTAAPARELKQLASRLGPARDWDVFLGETLQPVEAQFGAHRGLKAFAARCRRLRRGAGAKARGAAHLPRYRQLALSLSTWLASEDWHARLNSGARTAMEGPVGDHARAVLEARYSQVRKRGRGLDNQSAAELHRLRIAIKKFRYATDFFAGLYRGTAVGVTLRRLARLQDILGEMNDAATAPDLVARGFRRTRGGDVLEARGILLGWSRSRMAGLKRELGDAWREFLAAGRFW